MAQEVQPAVKVFRIVLILGLAIFLLGTASCFGSCLAFGGTMAMQPTSGEPSAAGAGMTVALWFASFAGWIIGGVMMLVGLIGLVASR